MSREWASQLADDYESGRIKWTRNKMVGLVRDDEGVTEPCFCLLGGIAQQCGVPVIDNMCNCGTSACQVVYSEFDSVALSSSTCYIERANDLGGWIARKDTAHADSDDFYQPRDAVIDYNDQRACNVENVVRRLRDFAAESSVEK